MGIKVNLKKKKILENLGIKQAAYTFLIYSVVNETNTPIEKVVVFLKKFEFLQILGIVQGNLLFKQVDDLEKNNSYYIRTNYNQYFFIQLFFVKW